jgi:hypothetical protein
MEENGKILESFSLIDTPHAFGEKNHSMAVFQSHHSMGVFQMESFYGLFPDESFYGLFPDESFYGLFPGESFYGHYWRLVNWTIYCYVIILCLLR